MDGCRGAKVRTGKVGKRAQGPENFKYVQVEPSTYSTASTPSISHDKCKNMKNAPSGAHLRFVDPN